MRWSRSLLLGTAMFGVAFASPAWANADDDQRVPQAVTVTFGGGLNTAQPGNSLNHHILPRVITVRTRLARPNRPAVPGVVNFIVGGFHQIFVYNPHITLQEVKDFVATLTFPGPNLFINYKVTTADLFYAGVNPELFNAMTGAFLEAANLNSAGIGIPPFSPARGGDENRVEQVGFTQPGLYLVICNITPHFRDRMYAWVRVVANDHDWDDDRDDDDRDGHRGHRD